MFCPEATRKPTAAFLAVHGLELRSTRFGEVRTPVRAAVHLTDPVDACLVTVKEPDLDAALERVTPDALGEALLVPLLNGIEHVPRLRAQYPRAHVVAASIRVESTRTGPGRIRHESPFAAIEFAATGNKWPPIQEGPSADYGDG